MAVSSERDKTTNSSWWNLGPNLQVEEASPEKPYFGLRLDEADRMLELKTTNGSWWIVRLCL